MKTNPYGRFYHLILVGSLALAFGTRASAAPAPKVTICHFPPGNPANVQVITVGAPAVPAHLTQHNDAVCPSGDSNCCFGGTKPSLCTNFQTDPRDCGACGNACPSGTACVGGSCTCAPGTSRCNGACVNESTDPNNCGVCGNVCAAGTTCADGSCTCPAGTTLCNGVCVNEGSDPNNCGACGNVCPTGATCADGACTCPANTTACNGACVNEGTDPNNCGACGNVCTAGTTCAGGACQSACPGGTTLCGAVCVNENTDTHNCGACGNACASGSCAGGACQSTCSPGTALCGATCVNENTDPNNCGSCGNVCAAGTTCTGGSCLSTGVAGSCLPTSSLGLLTQGAAPTAAVTAFVPLGSWTELTTGVIVVQIEPSAGAPTVVGTAGPVNSCSSNNVTGLTVCTGNANDAYVLHGTTLLSSLSDGATGSQNFSGGSCMTCGVATDASTGLSWLAEGTTLASGQLQSLNPATSVFGAPLDLFGQPTSEDISVDPARHLILSALENGNFQIIDTTTNAVFNSAVSFAPLELNSTAEDCTTGIALAPGEFSTSIVLVDLSQATFTPGAPGTWSAPGGPQTFPDFASFIAAGVSGIAVAPGSHLAGVTDEFGGSAFGVVQLPATSGVGIPVAPDWVAASLPADPLGAAWSMGLDPHPMTAYTSPNTGKAILAISNVSRTFLALVDMQALLNATRTPGTHTVDPTVDLVGTGVVTFVAE